MHPKAFYVPPIYYPESDGQPIAETEVHMNLIHDVRYMLKQRYVEDPMVHIGGNLFLYYVEGDPTQNISPDIYITFGMSKEPPRRTYKLWVEKRPPDVIFEMTSLSSKLRDVGVKKGLYEAMGVKEYYLVDPYDEYLDPPFQGYKLTPEGYIPLKGARLGSDVLGLWLEWKEGKLILTDQKTGETLRNPEQEAQRAEKEAQRAEKEAQRAEKEAQRAEQAEQKIRELEKLLAKSSEKGE